MVNRALVGALTALLLLCGSAWSGWAIRGWKDDSANLKAIQQARDEERAEARKQAEASQKMLEALQKSKSVQREVIREVEKIEYRDRACLEPDAVRLLNAAAKNEPAPAAGTVP